MLYFQLTDFREFAKVFPLRPVGISPDAHQYLLAIGLTETALALGLVFGSSSVKRWSCRGLLIIMAGAIQTLLALGKYHMAPIPALFFLGLLVVHQSLGNHTKQD